MATAPALAALPRGPRLRHSLKPPPPARPTQLGAQLRGPLPKVTLACAQLPRFPSSNQGPARPVAAPWPRKRILTASQEPRRGFNRKHEPQGHSPRGQGAAPTLKPRQLSTEGGGGGLPARAPRGHANGCTSLLTPAYHRCLSLSRVNTCSQNCSVKAHGQPLPSPARLSLTPLSAIFLGSALRGLPQESKEPPPAPLA